MYAIKKNKKDNYPTIYYSNGWVINYYNPIKQIAYGENGEVLEYMTLDGTIFRYNPCSMEFFTVKVGE